MPVKASAAKAIRRDTKRADRNRADKRAIKSAVKTVGKAISDKKETNAKTAMTAAYKVIDKAAKRNTIHANVAARKKARLMKKLNKAFAK